MNLDDLLIKPGSSPFPTAAQNNGLVRALERERLLGIIAQLGDPPAFPHPWKVRASRFEPPAGSPLKPGKAWRVDIAAGTINDTLPTLLYLRKDDPRGWKAPDDYLTLQPGEKGYDSRWIERDLLDDPADPPCLVLNDPDPKIPPDFTKVSDTLRNTIEAGAFTGEDTWELELWRAHVILSATPFRAAIFDGSLPPPRLAKYRLYSTPARPAATVGAQAGGWVELATLYLLRDPDAPDDAQLLVRQREFWPLWSQVVQPGTDILDPFGPDGTGLFGGLDDLLFEIAQEEIEEILADAATVEFWTV